MLAVLVILGSLAALLSAALSCGGGGGGGKATPTPSKAPYYTYSDSNCQPQNYSDPITVKLVHGATQTAVVHEGDAYGGWNNHVGTDIYFPVNGCAPMTDQIATGWPWLPITPDRYHMRFESASDSAGDDYSLVSPHHENVLRCGWHSVDEATSTDPSGYVDGTNEVIKEWTAPGRGKLKSSSNIGNDGPVLQCWWLFTYWASGDGWVYTIDVKP